MSKRRRKTKQKKVLYPSNFPQKEFIQDKSKREASRQKKQIRLIVYLAPMLGILIATLLFFHFPTAKNKIKKDRGLNILLITLDTTRADRIGCYGYQKAKTPNLDFLALHGVKFLNTYAQVPLTLPSHSSILTGTYPLYHKIHNNGSYKLSQDLVTLAEVLKENGFKTAAFVSSFSVNSRYGLNQGFEVYDDKLEETEDLKQLESERRAEKTFSSFSTWFGPNSKQKFFCWIHFYDPHLPYAPPSPFKEEFRESPYDGEIAYMDVYIGKIIDKLKEKGQLDKTLVVIAGDHGEALGEKQELDHGIFLYDVTLRVPFIICNEQHLPRGITIPSRVRLIDIMPTILEMLELPMLEQIQGKSLLDYIQGLKKGDLDSYIETYYPRENYNWSELIGIIDGDWKYIKAPHEELYNLRRDPREEKNEINQGKNKSMTLEKKLEVMIQKYSSQINASRKRLTAEEKDRLRSLGYLGVELSENTPKETLPDPKDKIEEFHSICQAKIYEFENNFQKAIESYRSLISSRPLVSNNYYNLANIYIRMNKFEQAAQVLKKGIENIPNASLLLSRLGIVDFKLGRFEEAYATNQGALAINPFDFDALLSSGWIMGRQAKYEEALGYYQKALEIEPENMSLRIDMAQLLVMAGRYDKALEIYDQLKNEYPDNYQIYEDSGILFASLGNMEKALKDLEKASNMNPSPDTYLNYAAALERSGDIKKAIGYLKLYLKTTAEGNTKRKIDAQRALAHLEKNAP